MTNRFDTFATDYPAIADYLANELPTEAAHSGLTARFQFVVADGLHRVVIVLTTTGGAMARAVIAVRNGALALYSGSVTPVTLPAARGHRPPEAGAFIAALRTMIDATAERALRGAGI